MALLTFVIIVLILIVTILNFIFFGPIIPSSDNITFSPEYITYKNSQDPQATSANLQVAVTSLFGVTTAPSFYTRNVFINTLNVNSFDTFPSNYNVDKNIQTINSIVQIYTTKAIIYIHGFNSTNNECVDFSNYFISSALKNNVLFIAPALPGTDFKPKSYENITVHDYLFFIHKFMSLVLHLFDEIYLFGSSTGCSYITWYLHRFNSTQIKGVVFWSPNIEIHPFEKFVSQLALFPCGKKLISLLDQRVYRTSNSFDMYQFVHFVGIMGLFRNIRFNLNSDMPQLLIFYNKNDKVVDASYTEMFFDKYPSTKNLVAIETDEHNLITNSDNFQTFHTEMKTSFPKLFIL